MKSLQILKHHFQEDENGYCRTVGVTNQYLDEAIKELENFITDYQGLKRRNKKLSETLNSFKIELDEENNHQREEDLKEFYNQIVVVR